MRVFIGEDFSFPENPDWRSFQEESDWILGSEGVEARPLRGEKRADARGSPAVRDSAKPPES